MNAVAQPLSFASAYRQLQPAEKLFVDAYVKQLEDDAARANERISNALYRPVPKDVIDASRGMLERSMVRAAINERVTEIAAASELTEHKVVKEYSNIAFASIGDYMEIGQDGQPWFDLARCTPEQLSAIKKIKIDEKPRGGRTFEFELHDKLSALKEIAHYMGLRDADNPHWRAQNERPIEAAALPGNVSADAAAEAYSRMING